MQVLIIWILRILLQEYSKKRKSMKLWIVRNKTGELIINRKCPYYHKHLESWCGGEPIGYFDNYMFPEVTFENSPQEVELKLVK